MPKFARRTHGLITLAILAGFASQQALAQTRLESLGNGAVPATESPWKANPEIVKKLAARRSEFNYDESKVPQFELPDPLKFADGTPVTADLWPRRRAELLELFRSNVYGRRPKVAYEVDYEILRQEDNWFDGRAIGRDVRATIRIDDRQFQFDFTVLIPRPAPETQGRVKPVPAIVHINNRYPVPLSKTTEEDPFWPARSIIEAGFATATFHTSDIDPDKKNAYADGVRAFFEDGTTPGPDAWRSLSAWGWGASKVLDYLETCPEVDASASAVSGHSRGGKTALWAAVEDTRFQIAYSNNSGCGGAALSRRRFGETVKRITTSFPYWFCENFSQYSAREDSLPIDQHEVFALLAPRAAYVASADEDLWADPKGEYLAMVAAAPVYKLLGQEAVVEQNMPPLNSQRMQGRTGYHIRPGGHGLGQQDWDWFLAFAKGVLNK